MRFKNLLSVFLLAGCFALSAAAQIPTVELPPEVVMRIRLSLQTISVVTGITSRKRLPGLWEHWPKIST